MSTLRIWAVFAVFALACATPVLAQTSPGAGDGNYTGHNSVTTSTAPPAAMQPTSIQSATWTTIAFRSFALTAGGWWTALAMIAPRVLPTSVRRTAARR